MSKFCRNASGSRWSVIERTGRSQDGGLRIERGSRLLDWAGALREIDYGRVFGPSTAFLAGTQLAGAVTGIRGGVPSRFVGLSYDLLYGGMQHYLVNVLHINVTKIRANYLDTAAQPS